MVPDPSSDLEEADIGVLAVRFNGRNISSVQFFPVHEAGLLKDAHSLEPVGQVSQSYFDNIQVY